MPSRFAVRVIVCAWLLASASAATAQAPVPPGTGTSYTAAAAAFNRAAARMDRLWSRTRVELRWTDGDGKRHFEAGEGYLIYELPRRVAMSVGKVGQTGLWAGSNDEFYWLFDLQSEPPAAWYGRHERFGVRPPLDYPLPIAPQELPRLLGVTPLPIDPIVDATSLVSWMRDADGTRVLDVLCPAAGVWMRLDPGTWRPRRVALLDAAGEVVVQSRLALPQPMRIKGLSSDQWPRIESWVRIELAGHSGDAPQDVTLELQGDILGGEARGRIKGQLFDYDHLADQRFKIAREHRVDLDQAQPREAGAPE